MNHLPKLEQGIRFNIGADRNKKGRVKNPPFLLGKIYMKIEYHFSTNAERLTPNVISHQQLQEVPQEPPPKFNAEDTEKPDLPL